MRAESEDPGVDEHKIKSGQTWQEGLAMTLMSNILASSGATSEVDMQHCHHAKPDSTAPVDVAQAKGEPEHLVTGQVGWRCCVTDASTITTCLGKHS